MSMSQNRQDIIRKTIGQLINEIAAKYPNNMAIVHPDLGIMYTYSFFLSEIDRAARGLIKMGIKKGDRVALWAPNTPEWIISQMALAKIGAILVPIDPGAGSEDLRYILEQSGSSSIIMAKGLGDEMDYTSILENIIIIDEKSYPDMTSWKELMEIGAGLDIQTLAK